jgi:O-antigen/teichoic acid export membrane protein
MDGSRGLMPPYILSPLLLLGCMTAAHLFGLPTHASTAAGAAAAATWTAALLQMLLAKRRFHRRIASCTRRYDCKRWCKVAVPLIVITICDVALQNIDALVVSADLSPTEVGMYFAAAKTMGLILFINCAVAAPSQSHFSALKTRATTRAKRLCCAMR